MGENEYLVKFKKPYTFEGKEYTEIDLSGLEKMVGKKLKEIEKQFIANGNMPMMMEFTTEYAILVVNQMCGIPLEFFNELPASECFAVKNMVASFFGGKE